jgi:hypothetical protein
MKQNKNNTAEKKAIQGVLGQKPGKNIDMVI